MRCAAALLSVLLPTVAAIASSLPGYYPQNLGRPLVVASDLQTLVNVTTLDAKQLERAHALMRSYEDTLQTGAIAVRTAISEAAPEGAVGAANEEAARLIAVDRVRDEIEERRRQGEFKDDPHAIREAWEEALLEAERDLEAAALAGDQLPGWGEAFIQQSALLSRWYDSEDETYEQLQSQLMDVLGEDHVEPFNDWIALVAMNKLIKRGRLSGERLDPRSLIDDCGIDEDETLQNVVIDWSRRHLDLLRDRRTAMRRAPLLGADAVASGNSVMWRKAAEEVLLSREAVRDHALQGAASIAAVLQNEDRLTFEIAVRRQAFPGIWRGDRAARALAAALSLKSLDPDQIASITHLQQDHQNRRAILQVQQQEAMLREESRLLIEQDIRRTDALFGEMKSAPLSTPLLDASKRDRHALSADTMNRLQSQLTESQWESIPGTASKPVSDDRDR